MNSVSKHKPELMAPAGYWPQLKTAIECGADAVYFGLNHFTARAKVGFSIDELNEVMTTLHRRGVKGFVTFNTLVFDHELKLAETAIEAIAAAGVDAVIVQDLGIAALIQKMAPGLEIHGSTQMSITSAQGAEFAAKFGCRRVVLGRELSLQDMRKIRQATDIELEVFVHGALCVSYSGQCFSSEAWGGRSANRGKCAQACRLSYELLVDDEPVDLGPYRYLLSPGDLCAIEQIPELIELGIACLKIEGRYKDANYVAMTTRAYRDAIDLAMLGETELLETGQRQDLEQVYSRGLGPHFVSGTNHQSVVVGRAPRHRGLQVGQVLEVNKSSVIVQATAEIRAGDGLVFDAADWRSPDEPEEGGRVYEVQTLSAAPDRRVMLQFGRGDIDFERIRAGDPVWRSHDPQLIKRLKPVVENSAPVFTRPVSFRVTANLGQPLVIAAYLEHDQALEAVFENDEPTVPASNRAADIQQITDKLGRLGGTPFHLGEIALETTGDVFIPTSLLNQVRRGLVEALLEQLGDIQPIPTASVLDDMLGGIGAIASMPDPQAANVADAPQLHVLVRSDQQLQALLALPDPSVVSTITLDYLELYGLRPAVEKVQAVGWRARVASPRILKPAEQNVVRFLTSLNCDIVVRSAGLLYDLLDTGLGVNDTQKMLIGDFSLNAANRLTVNQLLDAGLSRITPTFDLNAQQIEELLGSFSADQIEVIAYSHLPVFHTEHCVFCRFLSDGTDNTNCGHPCEKHKLAVRDQQGRAHPVMADVGCRNTVFGAEAQTDAHAIRRWKEAGMKHFRIELVHESAQETQSVTEAFAKYLSGKITTEELREQLPHLSPTGVTQGSLFVPQEFKNLVQLDG